MFWVNAVIWTTEPSIHQDGRASFHLFISQPTKFIEISNLIRFNRYIAALQSCFKKPRSWNSQRVRKIFKQKRDCKHVYTIYFIISPTLNHLHLFCTLSVRSIHIKHIFLLHHTLKWCVCVCVSFVCALIYWHNWSLWVFHASNTKWNIFFDVLIRMRIFILTERKREREFYESIRCWASAQSDLWKLFFINEF